MSGVKEIVINRMFVGDYLTSNLGHEIINLFLADNKRHYLYLNQNGSFDKKHVDIDCMLMVKSAPDNCFEVIAIAKGLKSVPGVDKPRKKDLTQIDEEILKEQEDFIASQKCGVSYGGISILDIFNRAEQQSVFITYTAEQVLTPKGGKRIILHYDNHAKNKVEGNEVYVALNEHNQPKTSLKSYIPESSSDYDNIIKNLIEEDYWESGKIKTISKEDLNSMFDKSLFDICQIQNDENRLSNALAYFMNCKEYIQLWKDFFETYNIKLCDPIKAEREVSDLSGGRIDLLISDCENIIVIENKIKSDINRKSDDLEGKNQLDRYRNYVNEIGEKQGIIEANRSLFILAPEYQRSHLEDKSKGFKFISYRDLHGHLNKPEYDEIFEKDNNFKAFRDVIFRHTLATANEYLYYEMLEKFKNRLKQAKQQ
ncbi:MAG: PD-(D/E)XK nuclease family protein [Bacteroidales bacterium]|nr:PD-(D/E)XK nuclease family protein [Bacteroidales bacterium]